MSVGDEKRNEHMIDQDMTLHSHKTDYHSGRPFIEPQQESALSMPEFVKALRQNVPKRRALVAIPENWSSAIVVSEDWVLRVEEQYSLERILQDYEDASSDEEESKPTTSSSWTQNSDPGLAHGNRKYKDHLEQTQAGISHRWKQVMPSTEAQGQILSYEAPGWVPLPDGGGWWKGDMTWL